MAFDSRFLRTGALSLAVALACVACEQQAGATGDAKLAGEVPEVSGGRSADGNADVREVSRYQLTMADMRKWAAANANLKKIAAENPQLEQDDDDDDSSKSLDEIEARIDSTPAARKAVAAAGLTAREYAVISWAYVQAAFAHIALEQGADPNKIAREAGIHPANLRFVKEHAAELKKLNDELHDE
jgi:hypothetical protein